MSDYKFWMVWREGTPPPIKKHMSLAEAENEARRLARGAPTNRFYVLESLGYLATEMPAPLFTPTDEYQPVAAPRDIPGMP